MKKGHGFRVAFTAMVFGLLVTGCDAINEFLGLGGGDDPDAPPSAPAGPKPITPDVTVTGGVVRYMREDGINYEIHIFTETDALAFSDKRDSFVADYLIVAGGGGAGGKGDNRSGVDCAGGGGAGGLMFGALQTLPLENGFMAVTVGAGGAGGTYLTTEQGQNGGESRIGNGAAADLTVAGGGGGGNGYGYNNTYVNGLAGGSGGGGGAGTINGSGGASTAEESGFLGKAGGASGTDHGGGGGGAGGVGINSGGGGAGWKPADNGAAWIQTIIGVEEFSHGGSGGPTVGSLDGTNYGDGGSAGNINQKGGAGHDGIVAIRFLRVSAPAQDPATEGTDGTGVTEGTGETEGP
jgi:hypothetical protein